VWDVAHFRAQARFTSTKQQDWIRTPEHVRDFIAGLVVRAFILDQARSAGLDQQPGYREQVAEKFDTYLLERMENALHDEMRIPEDTLRAYFNANSQRFAVPPQVQLREIVLSDKKLAGQLARQLQGGASFSDLARKYSERRRSAAHGGDLGFLTPQDLGRWSDMAFALHPGERKGPVQMDSMFVLLECVAKKPSQPRDFDAARAGVAEAVHQMKWPEARQAFVNQMRQSVPVAMFTDRLNTVRLN